MSFYTYLWLREDGSPYYVGKGTGRRAFIDTGHSVFCPKERERIVIQEWLTEEQAFSAEKFLIAYYGRKDNETGILRNHTDGGEGASNPSEETRSFLAAQARADNRVQNMNTIAANVKKAAFHIGRTRSKETRDRIAAKARCRTLTQEQRILQASLNGAGALTFAGETLTQTQWAARLGISLVALRGRIKRGWTLENALTLSKNQGRKVAQNG